MRRHGRTQQDFRCLNFPVFLANRRHILFCCLSIRILIDDVLRLRAKQPGVGWRVVVAHLKESSFPWSDF